MKVLSKPLSGRNLPLKIYDVMEDVFAGEAYRRQLAKVYTRLALEDAAGPVR